MLRCTMHCQYGKKPKIATFPQDFATTPEEDRAMAISNRHKLLTNIARVVPEISWQTDRQTYRQTDRHTHTLTYPSQYFATAPADEVITRFMLHHTVVF